MAQPKAFEHVLTTNPGVDPKLVEEAEAQLEALRQAGVDYSSSYSLEPALGTTHLESPLMCSNANSSSHDD